MLWIKNVHLLDPTQGISGSGSLLVKDGRMLKRNMRREMISEDELLGKIREKGVADLSKVSRVYMERNGKLSVIEK